MATLELPLDVFVSPALQELRHPRLLQIAPRLDAILEQKTHRQYTQHVLIKYALSRIVYDSRAKVQKRFLGIKEQWLDRDECEHLFRDKVFCSYPGIRAQSEHSISDHTLLTGDRLPHAYGVETYVYVGVDWSHRCIRSRVFILTPNVILHRIYCQWGGTVLWMYEYNS